MRVLDTVLVSTNRWLDIETNSSFQQVISIFFRELFLSLQKL